MNNLKDLADELIRSVHALEGFSSPLIEEELVYNLAEKLESELETKDDRIKALRNMFALGQIFPSTNKI